MSFPDDFERNIKRNNKELNRLDDISSLGGESFPGRVQQLEAEQADILLRVAARRRELSEDDSRHLRDAFAKVVPAVRTAQRKQRAEMESAAREGKLSEYWEQLRSKFACAKCVRPSVERVIDVTDKDNVKAFGLCEEHNREFHDKQPPVTPQ